MERDMNPMPDDLTPEELMAEADSAEALPERAAMSTLNVTSLDAAGGAVEAVGDHVPDASATDAGPAEHGPPPQAVAARAGRPPASTPRRRRRSRPGMTARTAPRRTMARLLSRRPRPRSTRRHRPSRAP